MAPSERVPRAVAGCRAGGLSSSCPSILQAAHASLEKLLEGP